MIKNQTIDTSLQCAIEFLNNEESMLEAQLLLQHVLTVNRAWLIAHKKDALEPHQQLAFEALLQRRLSGEPLAYILGKRGFYGLDLAVTPDTLIPRPDTETLVEVALEKIPHNRVCNILDLGTGSGAIALTIAKYRPQSNVIALDFSKGALKVAQQNAYNLGIINVRFILGNWFSDLKGQKFDFILSNPPYIETNDPHLEALTFEPIFALASGADGLDDIRKITQKALIYLEPQGWLMLEHGYNQAEKVQRLCAKNGLTDIKTIKDLGKNNRVTIGKNPLIINTHWN